MRYNWEPNEDTRETRAGDSRDAHVQPMCTHDAPAHKPRHWYLLTGLILGFLLGLAYAWLINPVVYANTVPASLGPDNRDTYRSTIAQVYAVTGDFERAESRLAVLGDEDPVHALGAQAQRRMAEGAVEEARALALLASALQLGEPMSVPSSVPTFVPTQILPLPSPTP